MDAHAHEVILWAALVLSIGAVANGLSVITNALEGKAWSAVFNALGTIGTGILAAALWGMA